MHSEFYVVEEEQAKLINDTKKMGTSDFCGHYQSAELTESATDENGMCSRPKAAGRKFSFIRDISLR